jgi:hypothetical protein
VDHDQRTSVPGVCAAGEREDVAYARVRGTAVEFMLGWESGSVRPALFPARIGSITPRAVDRKPHDSPST